MPAFANFSDLLPDPNNKINNAGVVDAAGSAGPGFAKIRFSSENTTQVSRTISGRGITSSPSFHSWAFDISYNPMTRAEFDPVGAFLEGRRGRLYPFYVILPQHAGPKDATFASNTLTASGTTAGSPTLMLNGVNTGNPSPGDFFNINDAADVNHKKTYKVIRVETSSDYKTGLLPIPTTTQRRVWVHPPISRTVSPNAPVTFVNPKFRVTLKGDVMEYELDTDNLYQFSLSLEEILP